MQHYNNLAKGVSDAWDRRQYDKVFAKRRTMGIGSSKNVNTRALPILELEDGSMAAAHEESADIWLRHFAAEEVGVVVPVAEANAFAR
eukprot:6465171-Pyramimonas_sp.AAC.1